MDQATRRRTYKLRFEELGDLRIRVRKPSLQGMCLLTDAVRVLGDDLRGEHLDARVRLDAWVDLADALADALIDWDLTDRGIPVPATRDGVFDQDIEFLMRVATAWYYRVVLRGEEPTPVAAPEPTPVPAPSPSAEDLALASIPFEVGNDALEPGPEHGEPAASELGKSELDTVPA